MSKAELFQELETLSRDELDRVAERVDELRFSDFDEDLSPKDLVMIQDRSAEFRRNPAVGEDVHAVASRILEQLKR